MPSPVCNYAAANPAQMVSGKIIYYSKATTPRKSEHACARERERESVYVKESDKGKKIFNFRESQRERNGEKKNVRKILRKKDRRRKRDK
jgi:hypothetical protein